MMWEALNLNLFDIVYMAITLSQHFAVSKLPKTLAWKPDLLKQDVSDPDIRPNRDMSDLDIRPKGHMSDNRRIAHARSYDEQRRASRTV
jgi:hypothetical protein